jgi:hypothetical protein
MQHLRANTQVIVTVGPFVDVGDGFTPQTDIALAGNEAELLKHGSTTVVDISGATWAAVTNCRGYYSLTLTTAHTNTEGMLVVIVQDDSDCLPVKQEYMVLSEAAWDSLYVAKDVGFMDVNIKTIGRADAQETEANNLETACANHSATRGLTGTALPAVAAEAAGGVYTRGSGAGQINQEANGQIDANAVKISGGSTEADRLQAALGTGNYVAADTTLIEGGDATDALDAAAEVGADASLASFAPATKAEMDTAHGLLATEAKQDIIDAIVDAIVLDTGTDGVVLSAAQMNKIADHIIRRSFVNACDSANGDAKSFRSLLGAMAKLVNKLSLAGGTLTITEEDDATPLGTQAVTTDAAAEPIIAMDTV